MILSSLDPPVDSATCNVGRWFVTCDNGSWCLLAGAEIPMAHAALNWTVRDLAKATGLHRNTIMNIEVGRYA
jgi:hypothetical protein